MEAIFSSGPSTYGVLVGSDVHVLMFRARSNFCLLTKGREASEGPPYFRHDGYWGRLDEYMDYHVFAVVRAAKKEGATRVVMDFGPRRDSVDTIAGLPVSDVRNHLGRINNRLEVVQFRSKYTE